METATNPTPKVSIRTIDLTYKTAEETKIQAQRPAWKYYPNYGWILAAPDKVAEIQQNKKVVASTEIKEPATEEVQENQAQKLETEMVESKKSELIDELINKSIFGNVYKNDFFLTIDSNGKEEVLKAKDFELEVKSEVYYKEVPCEQQDGMENNPAETKLVEDQKREIVVHIRSIKKDQSLKMVNYAKVVKDYEIQLNIHQQNGQVLSKILKVDVNDGVEARIIQIQDELVSSLGSHTFSFFVNKKALKIISQFDLDKQYLEDLTKSIENAYNGLLDVEKAQMIEKFKQEDLILNPEAPKEQVEGQPPAEINYEEKYADKITNAMKNRFWTSGLDHNPYVVTNPPSYLGANEESHLVITNQCKFAHLIQNAAQKLVFDVTVANNFENKNLRIAQTFDQITVYPTFNPALRFSSSHNVLLKAISLYGPIAINTELPGFNFEMRIVNLATKQETFCLCSSIASLPKHHKFFLQQAIVINEGDQIDIRPIVRTAAQNGDIKNLEVAVDLVARAKEITPAQKNKFVTEAENAQKDVNFDFFQNVTKGFGQVYSLFTQTGTIFGQDGVRFDLQNRENIGVSGIYYEQLSEQTTGKMQRSYLRQTKNPANSEQGVERFEMIGQK